MPRLRGDDVRGRRQRAPSRATRRGALQRTILLDTFEPHLQKSNSHVFFQLAPYHCDTCTSVRFYSAKLLERHSKVSQYFFFARFRKSPSSTARGSGPGRTADRRTSPSPRRTTTPSWGTFGRKTSRCLLRVLLLTLIVLLLSKCWS